MRSPMGGHGALLALLDGLLKVAGGFALGFVAGRIRTGARPVAARVAKRSKAGGSARPKPLPLPREELKMVLCVNAALKMGTGKIGAQCAHAAVGVLVYHKSSHEAAIKQWERYGQPKIALRCQDEDEMAMLEAKATALGMATYIVHDAGRTQIAAGSQTVLAIGPAPKSQLDTVTGHLKLL